MKLLQLLGRTIRTLDYNFSKFQEQHKITKLFNKYRRKYLRKEHSEDTEGICQMLDETIAFIEENYEKFDNVDKAEILPQIAEYKAWKNEASISRKAT